ncbi:MULTISPECIES: TetR/AcrR family transcriptional regulator [unclassified Streptomyces]|uniref:TetR/AcrR family transcriptional regulator n=1 Tax=unclassified Streptomyces TaxID=2593676 RepID=UPI0006AF58C4|nr:MULTISPECIES: TetR/AcrR family transcriptional regulator [unclassified Streptomyces]KOX27166.1 transcriptional regulator [Streptomyces sp. NRRL F-6491]KOX40246.1 transcriptional regulator [Streptomyces sp. NRRL F-6492]
MSTARERILEATEELLADKDAQAISTRAICDRAKVGMPEIYRQFGDKQGLLTAVADIGFARFLAEKRRNPLTDDPVADLRTAWDSHVAFALRNPHLYRLMFAPAGDTKPQALEEARAILLKAVERCRDAGRLRMPPELAGRSILSANVGVCVMALSFPDPFGDLDASRAVRDAVIDRITGGEREDTRIGAATVLAQALLGTLTGTAPVNAAVLDELTAFPVE